MSGLSDRCQIRAFVAGGWYVKGVFHDGQEITDTGIEFVPGRAVEGIEIVFTRIVTGLSGLVTDDRNRPVVDASVVIFPANRERWTNQSRYIRTLRPDTQGRYTIKALPPGEDYLIIAVQYLEAAAAVGLDVMSDWKNPRTQDADPRLQVTTPWRPSGGPSEATMKAFLRHGANAAVVYLPTGAIEPKAMHEDDINAAADPALALQEYWTDGLSGSLSMVASKPSVTHVFHLTLHPGELQGNGYGGDRTLDRWLQDEIDPLVAAGKAQWATYSQMKDAFAAAGR